MRQLLMTEFAVLCMISPAKADANQLMDVNSPTASRAVTDSTARVAYAATGTDHLIIVNIGSNVAYVLSGDSTVTAALTDTAIPGGVVMSFRKTAAHTHIAAIAASGETTTLTIQSGDGK